MALFGCAGLGGRAATIQRVRDSTNRALRFVAVRWEWAGHPNPAAHSEKDFLRWPSRPHCVWSRWHSSAAPGWAVVGLAATQLEVNQNDHAGGGGRNPL